MIITTHLYDKDSVIIHIHWSCNVCSKSFLDFVCCPVIFLIESYPLYEALINWIKFCKIDHFITYINWTNYWKRTQNISIFLGEKGVVRYWILREMFESRLKKSAKFLRRFFLESCVTCLISSTTRHPWQEPHYNLYTRSTMMMIMTMIILSRLKVIFLDYCEFC